MTERIRWGILGTGNIARQFASGVRTARRGVLAAVASREPAAAGAFAEKYGVASAVESYQALIDSPDVDAVYVSLPNSLHHEWTLKSLRSGKHVLCEKPLAVTSTQAREMFDAAAVARRVLVEAFMYRSHPQTLAVLEAVRRGAIGQVKLVRTSFCYRTMRIDGNIRFDAGLAGGALMDVGCYCLDFARLVVGEEPDDARATGHVGAHGVDELVAGYLHFPNGAASTFACGMGVQADNTAYVCGSEGYLEIPVPWKPPVSAAQYTIARSTPPRMDSAGSSAPPPPPRETFSVDAGAELYALEADDFAGVVLDGAPPRVTPAQSLGNARLLDALRKQIGLKF